MATVGSHQQAPFTTPINGTSPVDADEVRLNDNAVGTTHNAHDADATIHVQSSALASRPLPSVAGRVWYTTDENRLYLDTGTAWAPLTMDAAQINSGTLPTARIAGQYNGITSVGTLDDLVVSGLAEAGNLNVGGTATAAAFVGPLTGNVTGNVSGNAGGNATTATALSTSRTFAVTGDVTGSVSSTLASGASIATTYAGTVPVNRGGTGVTAAPTNGQLLIGNGTGYTQATLTGGNNLQVVNAAGSITLNVTGLASGVSGTATGGTVPRMSGTGASSQITTGTLQDDGTNVGVGTAPNGLYKLAVSGGMNVSGADAARIALVNGITRGVRVGADTTSAYVEGVDNTGVGSYQPLVVGGSTVSFFTNGTYKAGIASDGKVGIGTATPAVALDVIGTVSARAVEFDGTTSGTVTVQPAATAGTWTMTLPTSAGSNGQVLTTNGSGVLSWTSAAEPIDVQTFNSSGTWTKPAAGSVAYIEVWGAGGSGSNSNVVADRSGGGGGGYVSRVMRLSDLGATETVTIGAGGASRTIAQAGAVGGNSSFGSHATGYGGGGGLLATQGVIFGGSVLRAGAGAGGMAASFLTTFDAMDRADRTNAGGIAYSQQNFAGTEKNSLYGGGAGASGDATGNLVGNGTSVYGGNGGAEGVDGSAPAGGGGRGTGTSGGRSGAGAAGRVRITVW